jgi:hypothetical protein
MDPREKLANGNSLRSWKEIAIYFGVTVRSVQRWEKAGLPVHRQGAGNRARIFAYPEELQRWLDSGGLRHAQEADQAQQAGEFSPEESSGLADSGEATPLWSRVRRFRYTLAAIVAICLAGGALLLWKTGAIPGARVPNSYAVDGFKLTVLDAAERICWTKQFPRFNARFSHEVHDKVLIADIDNDGRKEVLFNFFPEDLNEHHGSLMCFEQDGRLRWEFPYGGEKTFAGRHFEPHYKGTLLVPVSISGRPFLLTVANHFIWYPSQVALLDVRTGRLVEEYWHPGSIHFAFLRDIDKDGAGELFFAGINNPGEGLGHTALGVLKLPFSRAPRAKFADNDPLRPLTGGGELDYVLFPLPDIAKAAGVLPLPVDMSVTRDGRIFLETPLPESGGLVYYLDFHLNVVERRNSDNFVPLHERFFRQRLLDHPLTAAEVDSLGRAIHFRAAPDGNSPEVNRLWKY